MYLVKTFTSFLCSHLLRDRQYLDGTLHLELAVSLL